jgi:5-formyltetrahydrofolate cyclo-ligase
VTKFKLRLKILKLRKSYSYKLLKIEPDIVFSLLKKTKVKFRTLGGYYPYNNEIDDLEILNFFRKQQVNISLPIIQKDNQMDFFEWKKNDPLKINKYGIAEPISLKKVYPDVIFVPLVAYDKDLNRLGYGGGFYDRYLEKVEKIKKIYKIGLAFSYQKLKKIPINKYDKKLDLIITEKEIIQ